MKARTLLIAALLTLGVAGTAGARDRRHDHDGNPPGRIGGPGSNWENPPGWRGGPGVRIIREPKSLEKCGPD